MASEGRAMQFPLTPELPGPVHSYRDGISRNPSQESSLGGDSSLTESNIEHENQVEQGYLSRAAFDKSGTSRMDQASKWSNDEAWKEGTGFTDGYFLVPDHEYNAADSKQALHGKNLSSDLNSENIFIFDEHKKKVSGYYHKLKDLIWNLG